ncbi:amino acid ABC transporter membrane protein 1 (PAAT family) [Rhizobium sp. PP-F2F-G38]|uniref:Amino acid ABC transporter permease n=1 Tax=Ferranicluibacter rubi TaxID=2715133 RepID=A0AA44C9Z7_9HYPH|nr:amino acid ABC transporter permease [Ferranicluibacter rubi]PYE25742.1 amino acid ABC transporter membrane protein 1 (PAAT family) [Rhizobium sp. PP-CC-3A-592]PYE33921.1 amino acid ABC transporter membrane protein 1 (PAAT family) [Rhizobium sp. PP-WC-1G-195]PYE44210.1 amino acid ABC transporter membrane protein 1 (PAAT family) [Rhizobium sp. PP-F2F-G20b]PYE94444.1 amino acid ABC transporter membrane protein 1 (PAAT family) [Rhizobium sp. PP-F2F-G38]TCP80393.1 amino acid ABC transporter memb
MTYTFDFSALLPYWPDFLWGAVLTLQLSAVATVAGFIVGTLCAIGRADGSPVVKAIVAAYVEVIRNTPLLVQVFIIYFGIATLGIRVSANLAAMIALTVNVGAYTCEIVRAGLQSIHRSQVEAAECLGLSKPQIYWHVIVRPAIERVYPSLTSQYVLLMLASSITSQISAEELTAVANRIQSGTFRAFETYIVVGLIYLVLSFVMRGAFTAFAQAAFTRRRKLGTTL